MEIDNFNNQNKFNCDSDILINMSEIFEDKLDVNDLNDYLEDYNLSAQVFSYSNKPINGIQDFFPHISIFLSSEISTDIITGLITLTLFNGIKFLLLYILKLVNKSPLYIIKNHRVKKDNPLIHLIIKNNHIIIPKNITKDDIDKFVSLALESVKNLNSREELYIKYSKELNKYIIYTDRELILDSYKKDKDRNIKMDEIQKFIKKGEEIEKQYDNEKEKMRKNGIVYFSENMPDSMYEWMNSIKIFVNRNLKEHPLYDDIKATLFHNKNRLSDHKKMMGLLRALIEDINNNGFIDIYNNENTELYLRKKLTNKKYDVFISHANSDKNKYVDNLYNKMNTLGVNIFYDSVEISWGDNWKKVMLDGTEKSEFAIIVISESFFGREWTEKELSEFLERQNESNQKIILPLLHNITFEQLNERYPELESIQAITTKDYSLDQIVILFAKELIKRYKSMLYMT